MTVGDLRRLIEDMDDDESVRFIDVNGNRIAVVEFWPSRSGESGVFISLDVSTKSA
jgi:hypothetical protein